MQAVSSASLHKYLYFMEEFDFC